MTDTDFGYCSDIFVLDDKIVGGALLEKVIFSLS